MWRSKKWKRLMPKYPYSGFPATREGAVAYWEQASEAGADAMLKDIIGLLKKYDTYSQYTGQDHYHLVRRLDIPNEIMEAITGHKYSK